MLISDILLLRGPVACLSGGLLWKEDDGGGPPFHGGGLKGGEWGPSCALSLLLDLLPCLSTGPRCRLDSCSDDHLHIHQTIEKSLQWQIHCHVKWEVELLTSILHLEAPSNCSDRKKQVDVNWKSNYRSNLLSMAGETTLTSKARPHPLITLGWGRAEVILKTPGTRRTSASSFSLLFDNSTQLRLLVDSCTSQDTGLSHASLWGSSVIQSARVLHCVDERRLQPHSSASCHDLSAHEVSLWGCNFHEGLGPAAPDVGNLAAFCGLWKSPERLVQSWVSCQLGGCENVLGRVTCDLRGGLGKVGLFDREILVQDLEMLTDAGHEGNGLAWMGKASSGCGVAPFLGGTTEKNPGSGTSSYWNVAPFALSSGGLFQPLGVVLYLWILSSFLGNPGRLFCFWSSGCNSLRWVRCRGHLHMVCQGTKHKHLDHKT